MTLYEFLKRTAQRLPVKTALVYGEKEWSYSELLKAVDQTAAGLSRAGIGPGDKIAIFAKNSPEFVFTIFACSALGAAAVPVNFYVKEPDLAYICSHAEVSGIVTQADLLRIVQRVHAENYKFKKIWVTDPGAGSPAAASAAPVLPFADLLQGGAANPVSDPEKTVILLYTSGTTGKPKGVMLSNRNLVSNSEGAVKILGLTEHDRFLCLLPMFHVFALTTCVLIPLYLGCKLVIVESIRPPKPWLKLMGKHGITVFAAVPQIYAVLAEQARGFKRLVIKHYFFRSVRFCISGAAPLLPDTLDKFEGRIGKKLLQGYGLSETSPVLSTNTLKKKKMGSVGTLLPEAQVQIFDENEKALPAGEEGEICVKGPYVMQGYYKQPEDTKAAFTKDGWFKTGDAGILDKDGYLFIKDRLKDMIIVKGLKVFSIQVEEVLQSHPAVAEAAVVGIPDASGDETVKAFVVLKEGAAVEKSELMKLCHEQLAPYKRPRDIEFRKELPKNALQKVLKRELRKPSAPSNS